MTSRGAGGRRRYQPDWPVRTPRSRRRLGRLMLVLAIGIVVTTLVTALTRNDSASPDPSPAASATPLATTTSAAGAPLALYADGWRAADPQMLPLVAVEHVIDGDTLDVRAAQTVLRVRAYGIDTPERGEPCYTEATDRLRALAGSQLRLLAEPPRLADRSGRELRYLVAADGRLIDATLIREGLARAWTEDGSLRELLLAEERAARAARRGCLWSGGSR
jgi:endonuclease YncB( thermonuclease family)